MVNHVISLTWLARFVTLTSFCSSQPSCVGGSPYITVNNRLKTTCTHSPHRRAEPSPSHVACHALLERRRPSKALFARKPSSGLARFAPGHCSQQHLSRHAVTTHSLLMAGLCPRSSPRTPHVRANCFVSL
jgi:hypothetical protein